MALSGSFYSDIQTGYRLQIDWTATQSIANNNSTVTAKFYLVSTSSGYNITSSSSKSADITIYTTTTSTGSVAGLANLSGGQKKLIHTQTTTVSHNADGTASFNISGTFHFAGLTINGNTWNDKTVSQTVTMDVIPRASTLTGGQSWTVGDSTTFQISRADSSFTHDIQIDASDGTNYNFIQTLTGIGTSYTWTPDDPDMTTLFDYVNNAVGSWNQYTRITLTTKDSGGNVIGSNQYTGLITSPQASTASVNMNFNIGDSVAVTISRAYASLKHTLNFYVNGTLISTVGGIDTSFTWNPSASEKTAMYNAVTNAQTCQSKLELLTFYHSATTTDPQVRSTAVYTGTATVTNSLPTIGSATYLDYNTGLTTPITGNNQYIIQNKSQLRATLAAAATAQNGATITQYICQVAGESITKTAPFTFPMNFDFDTINASSNQVLTITAYDSRGFTVSTTLTVNVVPYAPPVVNTKALRDNGFATNTVLSLSGSISRLTVNGVDKNTLITASTTYAYRVLGGSFNTATAFTGQTLTMPNYTATSVNLSLTNTSVWEVQVIVTDKLGSTTTILTVSKGIPILFIDDVLKSVGIGQFPTVSSTMQITGTSDPTYNGNKMFHLGNGGSGSGFDADKVDGWNVSAGNGASGIPNIGTDGVMEIGKYIDFHDISQPVTDYDVRAYAVGNGTAGAGTLIINGANLKLGADDVSVVHDFNSNSNGAYIRYSNGLQICWVTWTVTDQAIASAYSSSITLYQGTRTWTFPAGFVSRPAVSCTEFKWGSSASWATNADLADVSSVVLRGMDIASRATGTNCQISAIAVGKWK